MDCTEELPTEVGSKKKINIDISVIESIQTKDQDVELQSLGISVFDQNTFEEGVIKQYSKALTGDEDQLFKEEDNLPKGIEDGEIIDAAQVPQASFIGDTPKTEIKSLQGTVDKIEEYLHSQLKLQEKKNLEGYNKKGKQTLTSLFKKKKQGVSATVKRDEKLENSSNKKKSKYVGVVKKKKKEKLGTRKGRRSDGCNPSRQPGEENYFHSGSSCSEYIPSDEHSDSSEDFQLKRVIKPKPSVPKKRKSAVNYILSERPDTDDSDWENDELKRKGNKELDDGDLEVYCRRIKEYERTRKKVGDHNINADLIIPIDIWDKLYDYQRETVKWFWKLNRELSGGILGDEMGLGKTVQVIAFLAALDRSQVSDLFTRHEGLGPTLIVCPTTVMHQWVREFHTWYPSMRVAILHESGIYQGKDKSKLIQSICSKRTQGILVTSYNGLVQHQEYILPRDWHYVILDEGHKIRNIKAKVTETALQLDTPHRIILSGSPLQNNLQELWCLFNFVCPGKLGTIQVFMETFAVPIMQGGYANASQTQVLTAHKCATILKDTITPYLLRRMKEDVGSLIHLPEKKEQVLFCRLTEEQRELYKEYLDKVDLEDMVRGKAKLFVALINLRKICNHPDLYSGGPMRNFHLSSVADAPKESDFGYWERAGKMIVIETLLKIWNQQQQRVLLFTQSKKMLLILEDFVRRNNYKYLKLDGQTSVGARQPLIDKFNKDTSYFVMLLTTKVGGLGVNLTGANRVVIYDPDWNPATDTQARERAWRIGQQKDVTIYRLITAGTIEEKIYHRQIFKQFLSNKILKDPKQRRFFKSNDLLELFTLSETIRNGTVETAAIFAGTGSEIRKSDVKSKEAPRRSVSFSQSKIDQMKKLAQMLSKKISDKNSNEICKKEEAKEPCNNMAKENTSSSIYGPDGEIDIQSAYKLIKSSDSTSDNNNRVERSTDTSGKNQGSTAVGQSLDTNSLQIKDDKVEIKKVKKKEYKENFVKFHGQEIPHLVKKRKYKKSKKENKERYMSQDDYVLKKLFSKGIETAMKHDTIVEGGPSDYAIVEAEAERVAKEALKALKESEAEATRFSPLMKRRKKDEGDELLAIIKRRNMKVDASLSDKALLSDIISWLQSQGGTSSTERLLDEFRRKVGEGRSAVFKAMLEKVAKFYRGPDKVGYWTIRDEFNGPSTSQ